MDDFGEITISDLRFVSDGGRNGVNATVTFRDKDYEGPEIDVKLSADAAPTDTLETLQKALTLEAIRLLRAAAAIPDAELMDRLRLGLQSAEDRHPSAD